MPLQGRYCGLQTMVVVSVNNSFCQLSCIRFLWVHSAYVVRWILIVTTSRRFEGWKATLVVSVIFRPESIKIWLSYRRRLKWVLCLRHGVVSLPLLMALRYINRWRLEAHVIQMSTKLDDELVPLLEGSILRTQISSCTQFTYCVAGRRTKP